MSGGTIDVNEPAYCIICEPRGVRLDDEPREWWIGLDGSGQAWYCCKECSPALFASKRLYPISAAQGEAKS